MKPEIHCIHSGGDSLGESPLWEPNDQVLYWVDINEQLIQSFDTLSESTKSWACPSKVGCIGRASHGRLVVGLQTGFYYFSPSDGLFEKIFDPEVDKKENRLNDGKVDRAGRFWCGSMQDNNSDRASGALYALNSDGNCRCMMEGIKIPNSIAWSPDDLTMYFADTRERVIWSFDFDLENGLMSNKQVFVDLTQSPGRPDGATVDSEGYLWSAEYGGARVVRYSPSGQFDMQLELPVTNVTCCTFGGKDFHTLFITSAKQKLNPEELTLQPLAGGLFAFELEAEGVPEPIFGELR